MANDKPVYWDDAYDKDGLLVYSNHEPDKIGLFNLYDALDLLNPDNLLRRQAQETEQMIRNEAERLDCSPCDLELVMYRQPTGRWPRFRYEVRQRDRWLQWQSDNHGWAR